MELSQEAALEENEESQEVGEDEMSNAAMEDSQDGSSPAAKKPYHYDPILPPCRICGTKATGYHFGVITCEACKIFFRRSLGRQKPYRCKGNGNCNVVPDRRLSCSFCRLQKCHRLGMSRDGIQRGRYTVEKKSRCILEVKQLQSQSPGTPHSGGMASDSPGSIDNSPDPSRLPTEVVKAEIIHDRPEELRGIPSNQHTLVNIVGDNIDASKQIPQTGPNGMSQQVTANLSASAAVNKLLETATLEELAKVITTADLKTLMVEDEQMQKLKVMRDSAEFDQPGDPNEGGMRNPTEVDKRKHKFAKCIIGLVTDIKQFIKFAKLLPGFLELCLEDQILLLREGMLDWVMISSFDCVDCTSNVSICASCQTVYTAKDFIDIGDPGYYQQNLLAAKVLHRLKLYPEELAVFKALAIYSPDGSEGSLKESKKVEDLQARMVDVLCYTIHKNRNITESSDAAIMLGRFIHTLTETRASSLRCKQLVDQCLIQLFPDIEYPELMLEMFGDERVNMLQTLRAANSNLETDVAGLAEPLPLAPCPDPCDCDAINKSEFHEHSDNLARQQQMAQYEENVPLNMASKMAIDKSSTNPLTHNVGLQNISASHPDSVGRPPKKPTMLQTALLEDSTIWEELWAKTSNDVAELRIDQDESNAEASECDATCNSPATCRDYHAGKKSICVTADVIKYLMTRTVFPDDDEPILQRQMDSVKGGEKVKVKKKHHEAFPILPPCKVCGAKATGFHFGAITCDACQIFFRRSLERQKPYKCKGAGDCSVVPDRRLTCSYCRLQRCQQLGMSRDAIQRGRYTVERKTYCINEARIASEEPPEKVTKDLNNGYSQASPTDSMPQNSLNMYEKDTVGGYEESGSSGGMDSPQYSKNRPLQSGGVVLERSSPVCSPGLEANQVTGIPINPFHRSREDMINDTNNNVTYLPVSGKNMGEASGNGSSSMDVVSSAFRVMNDIESNEYGYSQSYPKSGGPCINVTNQSRGKFMDGGNQSPDNCYRVNQPHQIGLDVMTNSHDEMSSSQHNDSTMSSTTHSSSPNTSQLTSASPSSFPAGFNPPMPTANSNVASERSQVMDYSSFSTTSSPVQVFSQPSGSPVSRAAYVQGPSVFSSSVSTALPTTVFATEPDPPWISTNTSNSPGTQNVFNSSINQPSSSSNISNVKDSIINTTGSFTLPSVLPTQSTFNNYQSNFSDQFIDDALSNSSSDSVEQRSSLGEKYDPEVEKLIETVTNAHLDTLMVTDENREALFKSQSAHIEYRKLREAVFGRMDPLCPEQYNELYKRTGLDVDDRKSKISQCFLTQVTYVNKLAQFAQKMPGFSDLVLDDQITLLRGSAGDWMLFVNLETFDCEQKVFTCSVCHANYDREEFLAMGDMEFHDQWSISAQVIQKLELRDSEAALLKALSLFSPDGLVGLPRDGVLIQTMQMRIAEALCYIVRRERDLSSNKDVAIMFGRLVQALTELKHASLLGKRLIDRFIIEMFPDIEYPEVLMEIYGDETRKKLDKLRASHGRNDKKS